MNVSCLKISAFLAVFLIGASTVSADETTTVIQKNDSMNGFTLHSFKGFEKKWKLLTVRFRRDSGEMRFVYANKIAFSAIQKKQTHPYPNGSVLAKIGFKTEQDPSFPSSVVPTDSRRYQFMVKDSKKFKDTDGWGYALFDQSGNVLPEKISAQTAACVACHHIVPERDYIFSQYLETSPSFNKLITNHKSLPYQSKIQFKNSPVKDLPEKVKKLIPNSFTTARLLQNEITKFVFQGTLDEIKPLLSAEASRSNEPALMISNDEKSFVLVFVENAKLRCQTDGKSGYFMKSFSGSDKQKDQIYENRFCWVD